MPKETKKARIRWLDDDDPYRSEPLPPEIKRIDRRVPRHEAPPLESFKRWPRSQAGFIAAGYMLQLKPYSSRLALAGSYRRGRDEVGDMDILFIPNPRIMARPIISKLMLTAKVVYMNGTDRWSFLSPEGLQIDIVSTTEESWGACLQYFTGSRDHNISLRGLAKRRGLVLNEYGLWRDGERIAGRDEGDIYKGLGLRWLPPKFREGPLRRR